MLMFITITSFDGLLPQEALTFLRQLTSAANKMKYVVRCHVWKHLLYQDQFIYFFFLTLVQMLEGAS